MDVLPIVIQLITGAIGGNIAGRLVPKLNLGTLGNSAAGIVGGGIGGQLLGMLGLATGPSGALDLTSIVGSVASGGVGGGVLMLIIGLVKSVLPKKS